MNDSSQQSSLSTPDHRPCLQATVERYTLELPQCPLHVLDDPTRPINLFTGWGTGATVTVGDRVFAFHNDEEGESPYDCYTRLGNSRVTASLVSQQAPDRDLWQKITAEREKYKPEQQYWELPDEFPSNRSQNREYGLDEQLCAICGSLSVPEEALSIICLRRLVVTEDDDWEIERYSSCDNREEYEQLWATYGMPGKPAPVLPTTSRTVTLSLPMAEQQSDNADIQMDEAGSSDEMSGANSGLGGNPAQAPTAAAEKFVGETSALELTADTENAMMASPDRGSSPGFEVMELDPALLFDKSLSISEGAEQTLAGLRSHDDRWSMATEQLRAARRQRTGRRA